MPPPYSEQNWDDDTRDTYSPMVSLSRVVGRLGRADWHYRRAHCAVAVFEKYAPFLFSPVALQQPLKDAAHCTQQNWDTLSLLRHTSFLGRSMPSSIPIFVDHIKPFAPAQVFGVSDLQIPLPFLYYCAILHRFI